VTGSDKESLLYNFIEELLYLVDAKAFVLSKIKVKIDGNSLKAELSGDGTANYNLDVVKAPTYAEIYVRGTSKGVEIQMVVDV
jgi:SHS2 domain-containing protein